MSADTEWNLELDERALLGPETHLSLSVCEHTLCGKRPPKGAQRGAEGMPILCADCITAQETHECYCGKRWV